MIVGRDSRDYLRDIVHYAEVGERMVEGLDFDEFAKDEVKVLAALQVLEIIGEAIEKGTRFPQEHVS